MSKLPKKHQFIDLSDYGRPFAIVIANSLKNTSLTPIHVTVAFVISGGIAIICILQQYYWASVFFLILKSILDAADGELARINKTPSYTGRYLDSISDIILNLFFLTAIGYVADVPIFYTLLAFFGLQLQGTLYNYYCVILRNKYDGDTTSRVFEYTIPIAMPGEKQRNVTFLFKTYLLLYGVFDRLTYGLDKDAPSGKQLPNWFMTLVSIFGLGFQLLIMGVMLVLGLEHFVAPFFIGYTVLVFIFIAIRKRLNR